MGRELEEVKGGRALPSASLYTLEERWSERMGPLGAPAEWVKELERGVEAALEVVRDNHHPDPFLVLLLQLRGGVGRREPGPRRSRNK